MLKELIELGLKLSQVKEFSGKKEPDVITWYSLSESIILLCRIVVIVQTIVSSF